VEIQIKYLENGTQGQLEISSNFASSAWNRIRELVLSFQPDAEITRVFIKAEWTTILSIISELASLKKRYGFKTTYNKATELQLIRFRDEFKATREALGRNKISVTVEEIPTILKNKKFTQRELTKHQLRDLSIMANLSNGANFSVPGAGKTTVAFATHILTRENDTFLLVVAPKNAFMAWDEVVEDCMDPSVCKDWRFLRLIGGSELIRQTLKNPPLRMIISYDQFIRVSILIISFFKTHKVHLILDESHRMKGGEKSKRGNSLLKIAHLPIRKDILSGTPLPRSIQDIAPQMDFLWPGQSLGKSIVESLSPHEILKKFYARTTKQELNLPPVHRKFYQIEMSPAQLALYSLVRSEFLKRYEGIKVDGNIDLMAAKKSVIRLLQISSNPIMVVRSLTEEKFEGFQFDDTKIHAIFSTIVEEWDSPKIKKACEIARGLVSKGEKCVIWSNFKENVERIAFLLRDLGTTYIHGDVETGIDEDPNTREGRIKLFHQEKSGYNILVANPAACSEGISLHKVCHNAIYVDRSFNAAHYLQSVDRIHRFGLDKEIKTHVHILESVAPITIGSIDFSVRRRLIDKLNIMSEALMDYDLRQLALDEEEADLPVDSDILIEDVKDIIRELIGVRPLLMEDEEILWEIPGLK
jgi:SNF2 family DNA or RNA helicase